MLRSKKLRTGQGLHGLVEVVGAPLGPVSRF